MYSLVYRSVADESFVLPDIYSMLSRARNLNAENGITGCLLYHNSKFLQLIEGEEKKIRELFQKISNDQRHHQLEIIEQRALNGRMFNDWNMAFHDYGQNGQSAFVKMGQIDSYLNASNAFKQKNPLVLSFFSEVKDILFSY